MNKTTLKRLVNTLGENYRLYLGICHIPIRWHIKKCEFMGLTMLNEDGTVDIVLDNTKISINQNTNRLQAFINDKWVEMALFTDIVPVDLSAINPNISYNGGI